MVDIGGTDLYHAASACVACPEHRLHGGTTPLADGRARAASRAPQEDAMGLRSWWVRWLVLACVVGGRGAVPAGADELVIGGQCDRTGPTKAVGIRLCPGILDYVKLVNQQGG